jgi:hypothetical protein
LRLILKLSCLCLFGLLASPLAAQPGLPPPPAVRAGSLNVVLDPAAVSFLPIDTEELREGLCSGRPAVDNWGALSPRGECNVSVAPPPDIPLEVDSAAQKGSSIRVSLHPGGGEIWQGSSPVDTACGLWDLAMILEPDAAQPASGLDLETSGVTSQESPAQGVFAGVVKLAVRYRFVNRTRSASLELPAVVSLELSGHWAAAPAGTSLGPGASNLMLFTGVSGGVSGGQWASAPACGTWGGTRCQVCFTPGPDVIPALNGDH